MEQYLNQLNQNPHMYTKLNPETYVSYEKLAEFYLLHILSALKDWNAAQEYLNFNNLIPPARKRVRRVFR